jgi:hypothetical protein
MVGFAALSPPYSLKNITPITDSRFHHRFIIVSTSIAHDERGSADEYRSGIDGCFRRASKPGKPNAAMLPASHIEVT